MTIPNYINVSDEQLLNGLAPVAQLMSQVNDSTAFSFSLENESLNYNFQLQ